MESYDQLISLSQFSLFCRHYKLVPQYMSMTDIVQIFKKNTKNSKQADYREFTHAIQAIAQQVTKDDATDQQKLLALYKILGLDSNDYLQNIQTVDSNGKSGHQASLQLIKNSILRQNNLDFSNPVPKPNFSVGKSLNLGSLKKPGRIQSVSPDRLKMYDYDNSAGVRFAKKKSPRLANAPHNPGQQQPALNSSGVAVLKKQNPLVASKKQQIIQNTFDIKQSRQSEIELESLIGYDQEAVQLTLGSGEPEPSDQNQTYENLPRNYAGNQTSQQVSADASQPSYGYKVLSNKRSLQEVHPESVMLKRPPQQRIEPQYQFNQKFSLPNMGKEVQLMKIQQSLKDVKSSYLLQKQGQVPPKQQGNLTERPQQPQLLHQQQLQQAAQPPQLYYYNQPQQQELQKYASQQPIPQAANHQASTGLRPEIAVNQPQSIF